jgi:phosphomannomutase
VRVRNGEREELYNHALEASERKRIVGLLSELAARYKIKSLTTESDQIQDRGSQLTFSAIGRHAPEDKKRSFDPDKSLRKIWVNELNKELGDKYHVGIGGTTSVDITRTGQDKGWGIREFLKFHGFQASDAVFYGDNLKEGGNDYPARAVVDCVEVSGVSDTLQKFIALQIP